MSVGRVSRALRKYVFKCMMPQQNLAGNTCALDDGNDLLFKEVAGCGRKKNW